LLQFAIMHESQVVMSPNLTYCVIEDSAMYVLCRMPVLVSSNRLHIFSPKVTAVATTIGGTAIIVVEG
jgi:hypothetical protein